MAEQKEDTASKTSRGIQKTRDGVVISNKMSKSAIIAVTRQVKHSTYGKYIRRTKKYVAHDERNECGIGDVVRICESRPISRRKHWRVQKIISKSVEAR